MANDAQLVNSCILCLPTACAVSAARVKPSSRDTASWKAAFCSQVLDSLQHSPYCIGLVHSTLWPKQRMDTAGSITSKTHRLAQPENPGHLFQVVRMVPVDWGQASDVTICCRITFSLWRSLLLSSWLGTKLGDFMVVCSCTAADEGCTAGAKWKRPKYFVSPYPSTLKCCRRTRAPSFSSAPSMSCCGSVFHPPHPVGKAAVGSNVPRMFTDAKSLEDCVQTAWCDFTWPWIILQADKPTIVNSLDILFLDAVYCWCNSIINYNQLIDHWQLHKCRVSRKMTKASVLIRC